MSPRGRVAYHSVESRVDAGDSCIDTVESGIDTIESRDNAGDLPRQPVLDALERLGDRLKKTADQCDDLAAWIDGIISAVPRPGASVGQRTGGWASGPGVSGPPSGASGPHNAEAIPLNALVACATTFITTHTACTSALDHIAADRIAAALNELNALGDFRCTLQQGLRFLNERASSVIVDADRPRPGHLHVSTLRRAALSHRRLLLVIVLAHAGHGVNSYAIHYFQVQKQPVRLRP